MSLERVATRKVELFGGLGEFPVVLGAPEKFCVQFAGLRGVHAYPVETWKIAKWWCLMV